MFHAPRSIFCILVLGGLASAVASPVWAQLAMPTAMDDQLGGAPPPPPSGPMSLPDRHADSVRNMVRPDVVGPCGGLPDPKTGKLDKSPHGEVYAGAGSGGYRETGGDVCVPVGDHVAVNLGIDIGRYPYYGGPP